LRGSGRFCGRPTAARPRSTTSQSPSLRGSGRFGAQITSWSGYVIGFQSPSLRGSGRFSRGSRRPRKTMSGFNPLHCGAVVASPARRKAGGKEEKVSIPFIAGQWSLLFGRRTKYDVVVKFQSPSLRGSGRFDRSVPLDGGRGSLFQSPSLRGSGRFLAVPSAYLRRYCFNPLHCGAVVASRCRVSGASRRFARFNPLHCGAVVASPARRAAPRAGRRVSIPFIAGQWSLPTIAVWRAWQAEGFNPLHCGAVVAS